MRCEPMPGYFDSNSTVAGRCSVGCLHCTSADQCSSCAPGFTFNGSFCEGTCPARSYSSSTSNICLRCPFDCYTCDSNSSCLSCNSTTDKRTLSGSRCVPEQGYYENNQTVAGACPIGCTACSSPSNCSGCSTGFLFIGNQCQTDCPTNNISAINSPTCQDLMPGLYLGTFINI